MIWKAKRHKRHHKKIKKEVTNTDRLQHLENFMNLKEEVAQTTSLLQSDTVPLTKEKK